MNDVRTILLSGNDWHIYQTDSEQPLAWASGMISATVPGNIQGDLEDAHLLKPLRYGMGDDRLFSVCRTGWWYVKEFSISSDHLQGRATLIFNGIDYSSTIYMNEQEVGRTEGQFNRFMIDVSGLLVPGTNTLKVRIDPMPESLSDWLILSDGKQSGEGTPYHFVTANDQIRKTLKGLKTPATCSYDWGTNIYALGIWKDVTLEITGEIRIDWLQVKPLLNNDFSRGTVAVFVEADSLADMKAELRVSVEGGGKIAAGSRIVDFDGGRNTVSIDVDIDSPELWWPNGYGAQPLYKVSVSIVSNDREIAFKEDHIGFRKISWELTEGAPADFKDRFGLLVNDVRVRTLGSCITTPDLLSGRIGVRGNHFIEMAKACNMTVLRQHGGQVIFPEAMYRTCDRLGIMLLVDFPMGNCVPENEPVFLRNLDETIGNIIRQLRNHPSIIEWSGGNELNVYFDKNADLTGLKVIRAAAAREDDTRVFRDTCPISGSRHAPWDYIPDIHYDYYNSELLDNFAKYPMMRYGEFGCQTPANIEVWYKDIPSASRFPLNREDPVLIRKNVFYAVFSPEYWLLTRVTEGVFGPLNDLETVITGGQYLAAEGMRYAMDAQRAMGRRLGGFSSWDYNEPWPNGAGSFLVDYDGRPVMMYYYAKQAMAPVSIQLRYDSLCFDFFKDSYADIRIVSDAPAAMKDLRWEWVLRDRLGRAYSNGGDSTDIAPLEVKNLKKICLSPPENMKYGPILAELTLKDSTGSILAERLYIFGAKGVNAPLRSLLKPEETTGYEWGIPYAITGMAGGRFARAALTAESVRYGQEGEWESLDVMLYNNSDMTALLVEPQPVLTYRTDLFIDNNFLHIPPRQRRSLRISARKVEGLTLIQTGWRIGCRNADSVTIDPDASVIFSMGRMDSTNRGFAQDTADSCFALQNGRIEAAAVPYLIDKEQTFLFSVDHVSDMMVRLSFADQCESGFEAALTFNDGQFPIHTSGGLGAQKNDREQLAYPVQIELAIPAAYLHEGENSMKIAPAEGWATWDAMQLIQN